MSKAKSTKYQKKIGENTKYWGSNIEDIYNVEKILTNGSEGVLRVISDKRSELREMFRNKAEQSVIDEVCVFLMDKYRRQRRHVELYCELADLVANAKKHPYLSFLEVATSLYGKAAGVSTYLNLHNGRKKTAAPSLAEQINEELAVPRVHLGYARPSSGKNGAGISIHGNGGPKGPLRKNGRKDGPEAVYEDRKHQPVEI